MEPVLVKTMMGVARVFAIVVAWKAKIPPIWLCNEKENKSIKIKNNKQHYSSEYNTMKWLFLALIEST